MAQQYDYFRLLPPFYSKAVARVKHMAEQCTVRSSSQELKTRWHSVKMAALLAPPYLYLIAVLIVRQPCTTLNNETPPVHYENMAAYLSVVTIMFIHG